MFNAMARTLNRRWNYFRTITFSLVLPSFSKMWQGSVRDTEDERIHVKDVTVVKELYFVFGCRLFKTTRVSNTDVWASLKTFK